MATPAGSNSFPEQVLYPVIVIGTRAQLVKMAPVLREFEKRFMNFRLLFTGQHLVTMQELLDDFGVRTKPTWLGRQREVDSIGKMLLWLPYALWRIIVSRRKLLRSPGINQSIVIVHGDTISTLLGALAGWLNRCRVAHIESGLRSFSIADPFPEELIRLLVFRLIDVAFCPGSWATNNMAHYRVTTVNTGANTLLDAVRYALAASPAGARRTSNGKYCLVSIHRHENLASSKRMAWILNTVRDIARFHDVLFVLHPSTRTRLEKDARLDAMENEPRIWLLDRMGYLEFMQLIGDARFVLTDGGSNQEELFYLGIPTLIARERSERPEGLGLNAELISPDGGSDWRDRLSTIDHRLAGHSGSGEKHEPSKVVADWLEMTWDKAPHD